MGLGFCGADSEHHSLRQPVTQPDLSHQQSSRWDEDEDVLERTRGNAGGGLTLWAAHEYEKMEKEREATA